MCNVSGAEIVIIGRRQNMNRRNLLSGMLLGSVSGMAGLGVRENQAAQCYYAATRGLPPLKITNVKAIHTYPDGTGLGVVKVETDEPGLHGIGCATGIRRYEALTAAIDEYLAPFATGKAVDNIEDLWQTAYVSSYWRNGPILNTAMSGLDMALWDIKAKRANMPLYQLLGGKCRFAVDCYSHANGRDFQELENNVRRLMEEGYRHIRIQLGGYGSTHLSAKPHFKKKSFGMPSDGHMDIGPYVRTVPRMFEYIRKTIGEEVELLHDIHELIPPIDAIAMIKELEQYHPFFIEDPFAPEDNGYFKLLRQQSSCPIAMGELFNNPHEWISLVTERLIDYIRIHTSQIGGITPAVKVARLCEWFNVRTAWHGPANTSPVGHAAQAHIDLAVWNFGIQESVKFPQNTQDVFPGCPVSDNGYMYASEAPGLGIDIDENAAARFPLPKEPWHRPIVRRADGTPVRP